MFPRVAGPRVTVSSNSLGRHAMSSARSLVMALSVLVAAGVIAPPVAADPPLIGTRLTARPYHEREFTVATGPDGEAGTAQATPDGWLVVARPTCVDVESVTAPASFCPAVDARGH